MNQKKLDDSELRKLKSLHSAHSVNVSSLAQVEVDLSRLNKKKISLIVGFEVSEANILHFEADLFDKHNDGKEIRIDFQTGDIIFAND